LLTGKSNGEGQGPVGSYKLTLLALIVFRVLLCYLRDFSGARTARVSFQDMSLFKHKETCFLVSDIVVDLVLLASSMPLACLAPFGSQPVGLLTGKSIGEGPVGSYKLTLLALIY
jgi:hypothetical protein